VSSLEGEESVVLILEELPLDCTAYLTLDMIKASYQRALGPEE